MGDERPGGDDADAELDGAGADAELEEDASDEFLREVARVDDVPPPSLQPPIQPAVGERVAHFRVLAELGRGGMGIVYLAQDEKLRRPVALKVLPPSLTRDPGRRRRFLREARAAAAVSDPHLAAIYEVDEVDGRIYIAMERIEGRTLRQVLASRRLSVDEAVDLAGQIAAGLARAHDAGVVHRDLKPDNVMVTNDGTAKLLDFGLAKHESEPAAGEEAPDESLPSDAAVPHVLGTPGYMSPEQARGRAVDHRTDIFAFGVICYEMLTGARPFAGQSQADLLTAILRDDPKPVTERRPEVPAPIARVVERCLAKDPSARYQDCATIAAELSRARAQRANPAASGLRVARMRYTLPSRQDSRPARRLGAPASQPTLQAAAGAFGTPTGSLLRGAAARPLGLVALAALAVVVVMVVVRGGRPSSPAARRQPVTAAPRATAVTELPPPVSRSPEALAAFAAAMQGFRDGNWGHVEENLSRAVELDPAFAAGHLRRAVTLNQGAASNAEARESYALAVLNRGSLSERDQVLLAAYEPILGRDPPSHVEWVARLRAATERHPGDAELFALLSYAQLDDPAPALAAAQRAVELDPQYADGWQAVGKYLFKLGRTKEGLTALDRCISLSPAAADCRGERAKLYSFEGRCADMEDDSRRAVASSKGGIWDDCRAAALFALGRPPETVLEVFRQKWARLAPGSRALTQLDDQIRLDVATGRFDRAEQRLAERGRVISSRRDAVVQGMHAMDLVTLLAETGRPREAARVADDYLKRKDVWIGGTEVDWITIRMLWAMVRGRLLDQKAFLARRDEWIRQHEAHAGRLRPKLGWPLVDYAFGIETEEEARQALASFPHALPPEPAALPRHKKPLLGATIGKLYLLAGRTREAVPYLKRIASSCDALDWPQLHTEANLYLGHALERTGDSHGACAAYAVVLRRWGGARPASRTATAARARAKVLRCGVS